MMTNEENEELHIPSSVAIIMDGNGRWAKKRGLPRSMGHKAGCTAIENLVPEAGKLGIRYLTVYAFSTENWKRSADEVEAIMQLFRYYAGRLLKQAREHNVRIRMIGERSRFAPDIISSINMLEEETRQNDRMDFIVAANYGGRDEIRRAAAKYAEDVLSGLKDPAELTEEVFAGYLDTYGVPDPDLIIRTSGEKRLSNFLLWQAAYAEIVVTDVLWPDFGRDELVRCIREYAGRSRRFGGR